MFLRIKRWIMREKPPDVNCIFCNYNPKDDQDIHYEDEQYMAINDIKTGSGVKHILVITKQHIINPLYVKDPSVILKMKEIGQKVLNNYCDKMKIQNRNFRFGFHLPPINSIDHIHLHCFIQPLVQFKYNTIIYGWLLNSIEDVLKKIQSLKK